MFNLVGYPSYHDLIGSEGGLKELPESNQKFVFLGRHGRTTTRTDFLSRFMSTCSAAQKYQSITVVVERSLATQVADTARCTGVVLQMYDSLIGHDDYYRIVRDARFVVFSPEASDRLTASGVHADATTYCVPIISTVKSLSARTQQMLAKVRCTETSTKT